MTHVSISPTLNLERQERNPDNDIHLSQPTIQIQKLDGHILTPQEHTSSSSLSQDSSGCEMIHTK